MDLGETTWTAAKASDAELAVVPVGSTEQHGPHAPLGTDFLAAESVAESAVETAERDVVRTPTIPVGVSEEHRQFTGTLWVSPDTFRAYVKEVVESLCSHGWNRIVLVNGHGGNVPALGEVAARVSRRAEALVVPFTWFEAAETDFSMGHAGPIETSFLLHRHPELVETDRLEESAAEGASRWGEWVSGTNLAHDPAEFTANGTVGDPTDASAAEGEAMVEEATEALLDLFDAVAERSLEKPTHK